MQTTHLVMNLNVPRINTSFMNLEHSTDTGNWCSSCISFPCCLFSFNSRDGSAAVIMLKLCIVQMELVFHSIFQSLSEQLYNAIQKLSWFLLTGGCRQISGIGHERNCIEIEQEIKKKSQDQLEIPTTKSWDRGRIMLLILHLDLFHLLC